MNKKLTRTLDENCEVLLSCDESDFCRRKSLNVS